MRVWIITHLFSLYDGQGHVNYEIAHYLAEQGHQVALVATQIDDSLLNHPNIESFKIDLPHWLRGSLFRDQIFAWKVRQVLLNQVKRLDIVHLNGSIAYYPADVNASHFVHTSWLQSDYHPMRLQPLSWRSLYQWLYGFVNAFWEKRAYRVARSVVAVSEFVCQSLIETCGVSPDKVNIIWNGVDETVFSPIRPDQQNLLRRDLGLSDDVFLILFIGDLKTNRKNLDLVLQAMVQLPASTQLAVIGKLDHSLYPSMADSLGLSQRVHFLGHRQDVAQLLRGANAFVLVSNYDPSPLVLLEALACGLPTITTQTVGNSALIKHRCSGFVLQDSHALADVVEILIELFNHPELAQEIGDAARQLAEAHSWRVMAKEYEALYLKILSEKASERALLSNLVSI